MTLTYDKEANAAYLYLVRPKKCKVTKTVPITDGVLADFGAQGELLGIEILNPSQYVKSPSVSVDITDMGKMLKSVKRKTL